MPRSHMNKPQKRRKQNSKSPAVDPAVVFLTECHNIFDFLSFCRTSPVMSKMVADKIQHYCLESNCR